VNNLHKVVTPLCPGGNKTHDLLIASPMPYCYATALSGHMVAPKHRIITRVQYRGVHGNGDGRNPASCGYGSECCGNTAGMDLAIAGFPRDGFFSGGDPAGMIDKFGCKKLWSAYSI